MSKYDFENKVVWITGASSGLGLALAEVMVASCEHVFVTARNKDRLKRQFGDYSNVTILDGDITDIEVNRSIAAKIDSQFGRIDCVILNAGNAEYIDICNFDHQPFERMMSINFISMVKGIEVVLPLLRKSSSPYLVGMSSSVAWQGLPQGQAYSASKAAIRNLFQGLRIELAQEKIDVSWICPGFVKTPLTDKNSFDMPLIIEPEQAALEIIRGLEKKTPEIHFPKLFTRMLKLISMLPTRLSGWLLKGTVPTK